MECGRHSNINLLTLSEVTQVQGEAGNFTVTIKESPRYVDPEKCIACGLCTEKCPRRVYSEYDAGTGRRKAIYVKYAQAVPLKYQIDPEACLRLNKPGACGFCEEVCPAGAINYDDTEKWHEINVGAMVLATGFEAYDPTDAGVWGFGTNPNVITTMQLERYLAASGPTEGHLIRPSDKKPVRKMAFLQCIGSRDENLCENGYCSSVCCMYAIKEAMIAKDHVPGLQTSIFYMDMRTHGKDFDKYYERAKDGGVRFVRCRISGVETDGPDGDCRLSYVNEEGKQIEEFYDVVVLSVGLETPKSVLDLAKNIGVEMNTDNFAATSDFAPVQTSRPGIFTCGALAGPKDIPQSVVEGSAAASAVADLLAPSRYALTAEVEWPEERNVSEEEPKIGVFVCHCGSNIAGFLDVESVEEYAKTLPGVVYTERNLFSCSQDTQEQLTKRIKEQGLNRIVIAACTPRTHEPLFRETLKAAGLNEYLIEMANIRNHDSWVHSSDNNVATAKAKDLVRMAVAKVRLARSLTPVSVDMTADGLVVGGGVAGMTTALSLAEQGFNVHLVEKSDTLGGHALFLNKTWSGEDIPAQVKKLVEKVELNHRITLYKESEVTAVEGFVGNFRSEITGNDGKSIKISHGTGVIATGGSTYYPDEYGYGSITKVVTSLEFDRLHALKEKHVAHADSFVFIQCVGSREKGAMYCSKICCTHSVQSAIALKKEKPESKVYILYRDMRTYGEREVLYREARKLGVIFINYELHGKPEVTEKDNVITVGVWDHVLHRPMEITADMVILATAVRPMENHEQLAQLYKVPVDGDGFFMEAHAKLRPVDFTTDGLFVAGLAHYPKPIEESIAQAQAAAARAANLLSKPSLELDAIKASVDEEKCDGCALCVDVCPYNAISLVERTGEPGRIIRINKAQCKGCGLCQGTCPKRGVHVDGFTFEQVAAQIDAALAV